MNRERIFWSILSTTIITCSIFISTSVSVVAFADFAENPRLPNHVAPQHAVSPNDIIKRARIWVAAHIPYNQRGWYQGYREDCSGFVSMAWGLPGPGLTTYTLPPISVQISKDELRPGDVLLNQWGGWVRAGSPDAYSVIFDSWVDSEHTHYNAYEESPYWGGAHYTMNIPYPFYQGYDATDFVPVRLKNPLNPPTPIPSPTPSHPLSAIYVDFFSGGDLFAINTSDGTLRWRKLIAGHLNSVTVADRVVYASVDGDIDLFSANDGTFLRQYKVGFFVDPPVIIDGVIFVQAIDIDSTSSKYKATMYGLRSSDGSRIWQYSIGPVGANYSSPETPVVVDKVVYVTTVNGEVYALNTNTGSLIWSYKAASIDGGSVALTSLIVLNGVVYAGGNNVGGDNSGNLYALNSSNGSIIWQYQIKGEGITSLAADKDKVYVGTSKYPTVASVYALRASDARLLWHSQAEGITNLLTVANGDVYGSSLDGYSNTVIYRLHASDGTMLWSVRIPRNAGIPRVVKEVVYITSEYRSGRNVDALQAGNGSFLWEAEPNTGHVCTQNCSIG